MTPWHWLAVGCIIYPISIVTAFVIGAILGSEAMLHIVMEGERILRRAEMSIQKQIFDAIEKRGYVTGHTRWQFAARQVAKAQEELGELSECVQGQDDDLYGVGTWWTRSSILAGKDAREAFDNETWSGITIDTTRAIEEAVDVLIPLLCLGEVMEVDLLQEALKKATADVERGVR